jgi:prepilin-type N-terminal cleavage/methylation domain-containing protein/prepilin-type processing-associated H-X9-DG protein
MKQKSQAFTLVELLVVIAIIGLLVSLLLPALNKAREASTTIACAARMRQLSTAVFLYANANQGTLPPMCKTYNTFPSGNWKSPTIFPQGTEGVLAQYLGSRASLNSTGNALQASRLYRCPSFDAVDDGLVNWGSTYRYNQILGGIDKPRLQAAYGGGWNSSAFGNKNTLPWKLQQIRYSSQMALFAESNVINGTLSAASMALDTEPAKNANGMFGHNPRYNYLIHNRRGNQGQTNIAYVDGSVRAVNWKDDGLYPKRAFEATFINPYQVGNAYFSSDIIH